MTNDYRKLTIYTKTEAEKRIAYWKKQLRLNDWIIYLDFSRHFDGEEIDGEILVNRKNKEARITLLDPDERAPEYVYDMDAVIVHELLHIHFDPFVDDFEEEKNVLIEQAIESINHGIMTLERRPDAKAVPESVLAGNLQVKLPEHFGIIESPKLAEFWNDGGIPKHNSASVNVDANANANKNVFDNVNAMASGANLLFQSSKHKTAKSPADDREGAITANLSVFADAVMPDHERIEKLKAEKKRLRDDLTMISKMREESILEAREEKQKVAELERIVDKQREQIKEIQEDAGMRAAFQEIEQEVERLKDRLHVQEKEIRETEESREKLLEQNQYLRGRLDAFERHPRKQDAPAD